MKYLPHFTLELVHPYYTDGRCPDFDIEPSLETEQLLRNQRCVLKTFQNGVRILTAVTDTGAPLIPLDGASRFHFHLHLKNPDFFLFTDLTSFDTIPAPIYSNIDADDGSQPVGLTVLPRRLQVTETFEVQQPGLEEAFTLHGRPSPQLTAGDFKVTGLGAITQPDQYRPQAKIIRLNTTSAAPETAFQVTFTGPFPTKPGTFADVEIQANASLPSVSDGPGQFQIVFSPKEAYWRYFLITDKVDVDFQIKDKAEVPILFDVANRVNLNANPDEQDQVAQRLKEQYPTLQRYRFTSDAPIICQQKARKMVQLHLDEDLVGESLPNPALQNFARQAIVTAEGSQQEEILYHVLKFLSS